MCDRCGPAVTAVYRVERHGELYLCGYCTDRLLAALFAQGWSIWPAHEHAPAPQLNDAPAPGGTVRHGRGSGGIPGCPVPLSAPSCAGVVCWRGRSRPIRSRRRRRRRRPRDLAAVRAEEGWPAPELTEFRSLSVDPVPDPEQFTAPPGSIISNGHGHLFGGSFSGVGWEIAKTTAGLAAGGLGATIRYSPFGPFGPLRPSRPPRPGDDDAEAAMPHDDPSPDAADGPPASDEVLHLLYRGGADPPAYRHADEWSDPRALLTASRRQSAGPGSAESGFSSTRSVPRPAIAESNSPSATR